MSDGFILTGPIQTRVFDFMRIHHAIGLESKGLKMSRGSALKAATSKGYVPAGLVARGNINRRREAAMEYMGYVTTLLIAGGFARTYGEEIVAGVLSYVEHAECGCPTFTPAEGQENRIGLQSPEMATMCIHE